MIREFNRYLREYRRYRKRSGVSLSPATTLRGFGPWTRMRHSDGNALEDRIPGMPFEAVRILDRHTRAGSKVFEWGMGGSTAYFLDRGATVHSVEHDAQWYHKLESMMIDHPRWTGELIVPQPTDDGQRTDATDPVGYGSNHADFRCCQFEAYARAIETFEPQTFDVVVVNGRARVSCAYHAMDRVKVGGILVLGDTKRPWYSRAVRRVATSRHWRVLNGSGPVPYHSGFNSTYAYQRRAA